MNDNESTVQYLSTTLDLSEPQAEELADTVTFFGIDNLTNEFICILGRTLSICIETGKLSESYSNILNNPYFEQEPSIHGITISHAILSFNYLSQDNEAYKFFFYDLTTLLNLLKADNVSCTQLKLYNYSKACRQLIKFLSDNFAKDFFQTHSLREILSYMRTHYEEDTDVQSVVDQINVLIYKTYRMSEENFLIEHISQQSADGNSTLKFIRRIGYQSISALKSEMETCTQETITQDTSTQVNYSAYMSAGYKSLTIQKSHVPFISNANTITLNELKYFYDVMTCKENSIDKRMSALLLFFSANCGIDFSYLISIFDNSSFIVSYDHKFSTFNYKTEKSKRNARENLSHIDNEINISFPPFLDNAAQQLYAYCKKRRYDSLDAIMKNEFTKIRKAYRKISSLRLTEKRISNFFNVYHTEKYKLDTLLADYISCRLATQTVTKQHYVRLKNTQLLNAYDASFNRCLEDLNISHINTGFISKSTARYFGSTAVVEKDFVISMFREIKEVFKTTTCERTRFNFASFYIYTLMKLSLGLRPLILPVFNESNTSFSSRFSIIRDKKSKNYIEFRNLPLGDFLCNEFQSFQKLSSIFFSKLSFIMENMNIYGDNNTLLFLLNKNNKPTNFTRSNINELIYKHFKISISHLPANFLRHYFRTYLFNNYYNSKFMDFLMGHNLEGQEMLNRNSSLDIIKFRKQAINVQQQIIKEHDVDSLFV